MCVVHARQHSLSLGTLLFGPENLVMGTGLVLETELSI